METEPLTESFRRALVLVIRLFDPATLDDEDIAGLRTKYDRALQVSGKDWLAGELGLSRTELEEHLTPRLRNAAPAPGSRKAAAAPGSRKAAAAAAAGKEAIAQLRCLIWLESVLTRKLIEKPELLPEAGEPEETAKKQLRALELLLRAFISERYVDQGALVDRLRLLFKSEIVDRWLAEAEPGSVLTGTLFSELASIFTHKEEWPHYAQIYTDLHALAYLKTHRDTIRAYLDDIRVLRNSVAHHKSLSNVQIELLDRYYEELVTPIQRLFALGRTKVDPNAFMYVDRGALDRYFSSLQKDVEDLGQRTRRIEQSLETVHTNVGTLNVRTRRVSAWVASIVVLLVVAGGLVTFFALRERSSLAHDYRSFGWVTLSEGKPETVLPLQGQVWMGDDHLSFESAKLRVVAQHGSTVLSTMDLTDQFRPQQVGGESAIVLDVPSQADTVITCFSVPSAKLQKTYTVVQSFAVSAALAMSDLHPAAAEQVVEGESSRCNPGR